MKVLFYFGVFARVGGIEEFTHDLALALHSEGVEVEVLCASIKNPILDRLKKAGIKIFRIPVYYGCRWNIPDYALLPFALRKIKKANVVIHQKPFRRGWYKWFSRGARHVYITAYRPSEQFPNLHNRNTFFSFFDLILTQVSVFTEDLADLKENVPVEVVPYIPPAPTSIRNSSRDGGVLRVGMMGRLEPQKNPLYALRIVKRLCENPPKGFLSVEFHVYGSGSLEEQVRNKASSLELQVCFHGTYPRSKVPDIVCASDLFLITSVSEGQCIVALEILAMGRPLFATPIGALPAILEKPERGMLLPEEDADAGAECISHWLGTHQPVSAKKIQQSYLEDYDQDAIKQRYVGLFRGLVSAEGML